MFETEDNNHVLPDHTDYDHKILLKPRAVLKKEKVRLLSPEKLDIL